MTVPIVMSVVADPVGSGFVASLARPGANVTGLSNTAEQLSGKRLELLRELVPALTRVTVLRNPVNPTHDILLRETRAAAMTLATEGLPGGVGGVEKAPGGPDAATAGPAASGR